MYQDVAGGVETPIEEILIAAYESEFADLVRPTGITAQLGDRFEHPTEPRHDRFCAE
jgi:hypothetical protein